MSSTLTLQDHLRAFGPNYFQTKFLQGPNALLTRDSWKSAQTAMRSTETMVVGSGMNSGSSSR